MSNEPDIWTLIHRVRLSHTAAEQVPARGAVTDYPTAIVTPGGAWGRESVVHYTVPPGTQLPPGDHSIEFTVTDPDGTTATGSFHVVVTDDPEVKPNPRSVTFTDASGHVTAPPTWRFDLPTSTVLPVTDEDYNAWHLGKLVTEGAQAREEATLACLPLIQSLAKRRERTLAEARGSMSTEDLTQEGLLAAFAVVSGHAKPVEAGAGGAALSTKLQSSITKRQGRAVERAAGRSEIAADVQHAARRLREVGGVVTAEQVRREYLVNRAANAAMRATPGTSREQARQDAEATLERLTEREELRQHMRSQFDDILHELRTCDDEEFQRWAHTFSGASGFPMDADRAGVTRWVEHAVDGHVNQRLAGLGPEPAQLPQAPGDSFVVDILNRPATVSLDTPVGETGAPLSEVVAPAQEDRSLRDVEFRDEVRRLVKAGQLDKDEEAVLWAVLDNTGPHRIAWEGVVDQLGGSINKASARRMFNKARGRILHPSAGTKLVA